MTIKLNALYSFSIIARSSSFNEAAEQLGLSQQALSKSLAQLEEELGSTLILRNNRGGERLTRAGKLLLNQSHDILQSAYDLERLFDKPQTLESTAKNLRIGSMSIIEQPIRELMQNWETTQSIQASLLLFHSQSTLENSLLQQNLDLGIASRPAFSEELTSILYQSTPFIIVGRKGTQGDWHELPYLSFDDTPSQGGYLNVWPEDKWPRKVLGKFDLLMAIQLCIQGVGCIHIPQGLFPIKGPMAVKQNDLDILCPPPFSADMKRYLIFSEQHCAPHAKAFKDELLIAIKSLKVNS